MWRSSELLFELFDDRRQAVAHTSVDVQLWQAQEPSKDDSFAKPRRDTAQPFIPIAVFRFAILIVADDRFAHLMRPEQEKIVGPRATRHLPEAIVFLNQLLVFVPFAKFFENEASVRIEDTEKGMPLPLEFDE